MKNLNPRMILWMVFAFSVFLLWSNYTQQHAPKPSLTSTTQAPSSSVHSTSATSTTEVSNSVSLGGVPVVLENDVLRLNINTQGGVVQFAMLKKFFNSHEKTLNTVLFNSKSTDSGVQSPNEIYLGRSGLTDVGLDHTSLFHTNSDRATLSDGQDSVAITFTAEKNGVTLNRTYTLKRGSYLIDVNDEVINGSAQAIKPDVYMELVRDGSQVGDSKFYTTYTGPVVYNDSDKFNKIAFSDIAKGKATFKEKADSGWVGMMQHYFVSAWIVPEARERTFYAEPIAHAANVDDGVYRVGERLSLGEIAPSAKTNFHSQLYVGPEDQNTLAAIAPGLELTVDYGWLTIIAKPVHWILTVLHSFIPNWGWSIVALTILMKLVFFPFMAASYKSMAKMRRLQPKIKILQDQYGDDRAKLSQETMALYKAEKVNPAGGCLPIFITMPVFMALFYVLQSAVEMRGAPWLGWVHDLSLPDPYYVLPIIYLITMVIQTWLNPKPADPMQARMMWLMPFMFMFTFFFFPAGLVLYWVVNGIFSIVQQWVVTRKYGH